MRWFRNDHLLRWVYQLTKFRSKFVSFVSFIILKRNLIVSKRHSVQLWFNYSQVSWKSTLLSMFTLFWLCHLVGTISNSDQTAEKESSAIFTKSVLSFLTDQDSAIRVRCNFLFHLGICIGQSTQFSVNCLFHKKYKISQCTSNFGGFSITFCVQL